MFSAQTTSGCVPLTVSFIDSSTSNPTSWDWDIDDNGSTDYTVQNPTHTYTTAGTYSVELTVTNSVSSSSTVMTNYITVFGLPTVIAGGTSNICTGATATLTASGAVNYSWDNGAGTGSSVSVSPTTSTTYTVTGTDGNGCQNTDQVSVTVNSLPTATVTTIDASCGNADGSATVTASSGTSPYTYSWSSGSTGTAESNLVAGVYPVTITDANGCNVTEDVTINEIGAPIISISTSTNASCVGCCDGSATVSATGGTMPYTYLWDDISGQTTATATGLCTGTYNVTVTGADNCGAVVSVTITDIVGINITGLDRRIKIYPNPNTGEFVIEVNSVDKLENPRLRIANTIGQVIYEEALEQNSSSPTFWQIDLRSYPTGMYSLHLYSDHQVITRKVLIIDE